MLFWMPLLFGVYHLTGALFPSSHGNIWRCLGTFSLLLISWICGAVQYVCWHLSAETSYSTVLASSIMPLFSMQPLFSTLHLSYIQNLSSIQPLSYMEVFLTLQCTVLTFYQKKSIFTVTIDYSFALEKSKKNQRNGPKTKKIQKRPKSKLPKPKPKPKYPNANLNWLIPITPVFSQRAINMKCSATKH